MLKLIIIIGVFFFTLSHSLESCEERKVKCDEIIKLSEIEGFWADEDEKIFFIESSDRPHLNARQSCSVESALRTNPQWRVLVVLTSPTLDLSKDNATCHLYNANNPNLHFRRVDKSRIFSGTPIESVYKSGKLDSSPTPVVHFSDAIRLVLIYKFGGFYADLDIVFLRRFPADLKNVFASDQVTQSDAQRAGKDYWGHEVCNAIFHLDKNHPMLKRSLAAFEKNFSGKWSSGGADILTVELMRECGYEKKISFGPGLFTPEKCNGIKVLRPKTFYPFGYFEAHEMGKSKTDEEWIEILEQSYTVHYFATSSRTQKKVLKPKNYGKVRPAMIYLGVNFCPISFDSVKIF